MSENHIKKDKPTISELLAAMSKEQFGSHVESVLEELDRGETPVGGRPYLDAIIAELKRRDTCLKAEFDSLQEELQAMKQDFIDKNEKVDRLRQENQDLGQTLATMKRDAGLKVGRNEPCPCGSGKKYKYCCGR